MAKQFIKLSFFILSTVTVLLAAEENLLSNGGFETTLTGWTLEQNNDSVAATRDTVTVDDAKEGNKVLRIKVDSIASENWYVQLKDPSWEAVTGNIYTFSMWARSKEDAYQVQISAYGKPDEQYGWVASSDLFTLSSEWTQYKLTTISEVSGKGKMNFAVVCGSTTGTFEIDDVVITEEVNTNGNIYANGGFESEESGWSLFLDKDTDGEAAMSFPADGAKTGSKFCKINVTKKPAESWEIQLQDGNWKAELGEYTFKFWAKAKDDGAQVSAVAQYGSTRSYEIISSSPFELTTEWAEYSFTFSNIDIVGTDSISINIYCGIDMGEYDFDDVSLTLEPVSIRPSSRGPQNKQSIYTFELLGNKLKCTGNSAINKVMLCDVQGRIFHTHKVNGKAVSSLNLPRPSSGTWIVKIESDNIATQNQKIILP